MVRNYTYGDMAEIASFGAIEVDNYLCGKDTNFDNIRKFVNYVLSSNGSGLLRADPEPFLCFFALASNE